MLHDTYDDPIWHGARVIIEKKEISEAEKERELAFLEYVQILNSIDQRLKAEKKQGPKVAPPDEFWMDPE